MFVFIIIYGEKEVRGEGGEVRDVFSNDKAFLAPLTSHLSKP